MSGSAFRMLLKDLMIKIFWGIKPYLLKMKSSKLKFAAVNFWLIYLDLMKVQHLARTPVQENDLNMRVLAWEKCCRFIFISTR